MIRSLETSYAIDGYNKGVVSYRKNLKHIHPYTNENEIYFCGSNIYTTLLVSL